ncbi:MAG TPA: hypothetical protein VEJ18_21315 [Planctomycetota bacterium]|nr:hypothetical protein [Planctomycetota bacterium]
MKRRTFLGTTASLGAALGLPPVLRGQTLRPFRPDDAVAPLLALIEDSPQAGLVEAVAARIRAGATYPQVLAALLLAGVRNIRPRPSVGFKFHAVLVVHAAHQAAQTAPDADRWLPLLWAIDHFKRPQAEEKRVSGWTQKPPAENKIPPADRARDAFVEAMEKWDEDAADAAATAVARHLPPAQAFELFARYAARDFRSIGHKAIYCAGAFRLLTLIGWAHAEPVLRSLAYAYLAHEGAAPDGTAAADRPWARNRVLAKDLPEGWRAGSDDGALEVLATCRAASDEDVPARVVELLRKGASAASMWDGLFLHAGELLMRRPNIASLHEVTTANAVRHLYDATADDATRRLLLLQMAAFAPLFRGDPTKLSNVRIDALPGAAPDRVEAVFESGEKAASAQAALGWLSKGSAADFIETARRLLFAKGRDAHDYKFAMAALEDHAKVSPRWRDRVLASSVYWLKGAGSPDNGLVERIRAALR